jgi:hypothetical protein
MTNQIMANQILANQILANQSQYGFSKSTVPI